MTTRRRAEAEGIGEVKPPDRGAALRCEWETRGARCFLTSGGIRSGRGYCDWHLFCLMRTVAAENWEEFSRFHAHAETYCCEEAHWAIDRVWKAALGQEDLRLADRRPCVLPFCRHRMDRIEPALHGRRGWS